MVDSDTEAAPDTKVVPDTVAADKEAILNTEAVPDKVDMHRPADKEEDYPHLQSCYIDSFCYTA